jgi:uncharacterized protein
MKYHSYQNLIVFILAFFYQSSQLLAQNEVQYAVTAKAAVKDPAIFLRWAPENYDTWLNAQKFGYKVVRYTVGIGPEVFPTPKEIFTFPTTFKVTPESNWVMKYGKMDTLAFAALYEKSFSVYINSGGNQSGQLLKAYQLEEEKKNRFIYSLFAAEQNLGVAQKLGLFLEDRKVEPDFRYTYYIYPILEGDKLGKPAVVTVINNLNLQNLPQLPKPEAKGEDKVAILSMNIEGAGSEYFAYDLYRRVLNTGNFQKINKNPILFSNENEKGGSFLSYADPLPDNDKTYEYYFKGVNSFGMGTISPYVTVKGVPAPLDATIRISAVSEINNAIVLSWEFPVLLNSKIKGFKVLRSEDALGRFVPVQTALLPKDARTFTTTPPKGAAYYRIVSVDLYDREIASIDVLGQIKDITPPVKPILVSCESDDEGKVSIRWKRNPDADIKGYRVFLSSIKAENDYFQITNDVVADTVFEYVTTLNTLSEEAYFKIAAEDLHSNRSVNSEVCVMKRPDIIPPVPPLIRKADISTRGVDLEWVESSSSDVVSHRVQRKELIASGQWTTLATFDKKGKSSKPAYIDSSALNTTTYLYRIAATDDANLVSYSKTIQVKPAVKTNRSPIAELIPYCECDYIQLKTNQRINAGLIPSINGGHPIVDIFHVKNPNSPWSSGKGNSLIDEFLPLPTPNQRPENYSVILEWTYDGDWEEVEDFEIYRALPRDTIATAYGYSYPGQMDVAYDPVVYSFAQDPTIIATLQSIGKVNITGKAMIPMVDDANKAGQVHQFMDHLILIHYFGQAIKYGALPLTYQVVVRFKDGSESPLSAPLKIYFK